MGRIVGKASSPGKRRNAHERSCAEVLRLLAERRGFDDEARDMASFLVFCLRGIYETIDESAAAWDERDYWKKAEALRQKYSWARLSADELERLILAGQWNDVPGTLIGLLPNFSHVTVTTITRDPDWWCGAYRALVKSAENGHTNP